jgi:3'-5' exoribonuclease
VSRLVSVAELTSLPPDDEVAGRFVVAAKSLLVTRTGKPYLALTLTDKTGSIEAKVWDLAEAMNQAVGCDRVVEVSGRTNVFQGKTQLVIDNARLLAEDEIDPADFLPVSPRDRDQMWSELIAWLGRITQPELKVLIEAVFGDPAVAEGFRRAPAAKRFHHACLGGLLEHTLSVAGLCARAAEHYPETNAQLLLCGALLHDIGKIDEFDYRLKIDYTDAGRLVGHIVLGAELVAAKARAVGIGERVAHLVGHLILSHHGSPEFGSPVRPATLEAMILHQLDDLDAKADARRRFIDRHGDPEAHWSPYNNLMERFFYIGPDPVLNGGLAGPETAGAGGAEDPTATAPEEDDDRQPDLFKS